VPALLDACQPLEGVQEGEEAAGIREEFVFLTLCLLASAVLVEQLAHPLLRRLLQTRYRGELLVVLLEVEAPVVQRAVKVLLINLIPKLELDSVADALHLLEFRLQRLKNDRGRLLRVQPESMLNLGALLRFCAVEAADRAK